MSDLSLSITTCRIGHTKCFFLEFSTASYFPAIIGRTILKFQPSPIYSSPVQNSWHCVNRLDSSHAWKDTVVNSPWSMWHTSTHTTFYWNVFTSNHSLRAPQLSLSQCLYSGMWRSIVWRMRISGLPRNVGTTYHTTRRHIPKTAVKPYFFIGTSLI